MSKNKDDLLRIQYNDLEDIRLEFLKYAPAYAQKEAGEALYKVIELQSQGILRDGVYYIVLADLVDSTKYSAEHGNAKLAQRIRHFVKFSFDALNESEIKNTSVFLKEIGDAVLFVFQHFPDILKWRDSFQKYLDLFKDADPYEFRTCIHIGEVSLDGVIPISLAVSQTFKMEKSVGANDIVLTAPAFHVAWPTIMRAYHGFSDYGQVDLDGFKDSVDLYKLRINDSDDLARIIEEGSITDY